VIERRSRSRIFVNALAAYDVFLSDAVSRPTDLREKQHSVSGGVLAEGEQRDQIARQGGLPERNVPADVKFGRGGWIRSTDAD
jgi:hypothetical protein